MSILARILAPLDHDVAEHRRENFSVAEANARQTRRVLRDELGDQWNIVLTETDPETRMEALAEIKRIEEQLARM